MEIIKLPIEGMSCHSCEQILTRAVKKLNGVRKIQISYVTGTAQISFDKTCVDEDKIRMAIEQAGYRIGEQKSDRSSNILKAALVLVLLFGLFRVLDVMGFFTVVPEIAMSMSFAMLFLVGILTSVHCIAMCGGINISAVASRKQVGVDVKASAKPGLLYNAGRVVSYTLTGAAVGALGQVVAISESGRNMIAMAAGLFMISMGLNMLGFLPWLRHIRLPLPRSAGRVKAKLSSGSPFYIGLLNGLMPCGPLQTMQLYALGAGSMVMGALSMFFFAMGTVPLMFGISFLAGLFSARKNMILKIISAGLVIILGMQMFGRGVDLSSVKLPGQIQDRVQVSASGTAAVIDGDFQIVETRFTNGQYQPIIVQANIPVRWIILAEEGDLNGCNNSIQINSYGVTKDLEYGENLVEFMPDELGMVRYTCWMNMIVNYITVVEDLDSSGAEKQS